MWMFRVAVRNDHLRQTDPPEYRTLALLVPIVEPHIVQDQPLAVIETDVEPPVQPLHLAPFHCEAHALRLSDVNGLDVVAISSTGGIVLFDPIGVVVGRRGLVEGPSGLGYVDVDDLMAVGVEDGTEVERVGVLRIVWVRAVVHEGLLEANLVAEAGVVADCPCCW